MIDIYGQEPLWILIHTVLWFVLKLAQTDIPQSFADKLRYGVAESVW